MDHLANALKQPLVRLNALAVLVVTVIVDDKRELHARALAKLLEEVLLNRRAEGLVNLAHLLVDANPLVVEGKEIVVSLLT